MAIRTAAGELQETYDALREHPDLFRPAPYPTTDLVNADAAWIEDLPRERPAEHLLLEVVDKVTSGLNLSRTGLIVATASGNIAAVFERTHAATFAGTPAPEPRDGRDGPTRWVAEQRAFGGPVTTLSVACVSGTAAFTVADLWLASGLCDEVVVAGVDAACQYVHAGFSGLGALSKTRPRPFTAAHDGMLLGEGAAAVRVAREGRYHIAGTGLACDAKHATAPDREATGAIRAALDALLRSGVGPDDIHTVSPHATGTPFNDAMEAVVLRTLFDQPKRLQLVKPVIGHTLGAAGTLETALAIRALAERPGAILSLSSAFGGMNAALVLSTQPGQVLPDRPVVIEPPVEEHVDLKTAWPDAPPTVFRHDVYWQRGLAALLAEHARSPLQERTALVLASRTNCDSVDRTHHRRILAHGPARASRRAFADTLPASPLCAASIHLGVRGPLLAFVDDPERARDEAARLVKHGFADDAVAVALEVTSPEDPRPTTVWRLHT
jgi:hypothetical protein